MDIWGLKNIALGIVGSRSFSSKDLIRKAFESRLDISKVVSGGANGADSLGVEVAREYGITNVEIFRPVWRRGGVYNPNAGMERNTDIVKASDVVWAFWDGNSNGTRDSITKSLEMGKPTIITLTSGVQFVATTFYDKFTKYNVFFAESEELLNVKYVIPLRHPISSEKFSNHIESDIIQSAESLAIKFPNNTTNDQISQIISEIMILEVPVIFIIGFDNTTNVS